MLTWGFLLCGLLAVLSLAWEVAPARAGQYTVWSCQGPTGLPISAAAWSVNITDAAAADMRAADECASGGPLLIEATPTGPISSHSPTGEAIFGPPAGTVIRSFKVWRYAFANDGPNTPADTDDYGASLREWLVGTGEGIVPECGLGFRTGGRCEYGTPDEPFAESNLVTEHTWTGEMTPGEGVPPLEQLGFWVSCIRTGCEPAATGTTAIFELFGAAITIEDDDAPTIDRLEGPLSEPVPVSGVANLLVSATDQGGGVAGFAFSVDGGAPQRVNATSGGSCEEPYSAAQPCPSTATRGISIDTAALSAGAHTVAGAVTDAAGNSTPFGPVTFTVASPVASGSTTVELGKQPDNGTPAVENPRLRLSHVRGSGGKDGAARLQGTLLTQDGVPIVGALLQVEISELGATHRPRALEVHTDADGHFGFEVPGDGARTAVVSYSPTLGGSVSRTAKAVVKMPLSLRLAIHPHRASNGQTVQFRGRLDGAGQAAGGATAEIQAIADGRWTTVDTATVGSDGTFVWAHRFRFVERDALFSFRAVVPRTPGWPWPTVRSPRIKLPIAAVPG